MAERVDVCIVGSGFGGSIAAFRLAELYRAADTEASVLVLERGKRFGHRDFRQSMDVDHLSDVYGLIQGQGAQVVLANLVGGGSNLYLGASLRAPRDIFERTDVHPSDRPRRRLWPREINRGALNRFYARAERALRVRQPSWSEVSKSGGVWASMLREAGHTCDRVPLAFNFDRCVDAKWCYTGCIFGAKNSLITNYLPAAERRGVEVRPLAQVNEVEPSSARPYRWIVRGTRVDPRSKQSAGAFEEVECKVLILAAGAMGTPPILMRSRQNGALPAVSPQLGKHLGVNGDHVAAIEVDERRARQVLGLPGYSDFHKGKPITVMSYDWWVGKHGAARDGTRFTLQEILLSQLTNFLYGDGRGDGEPSWWGREKKRSISTWSRHIEILAMVEDTHDGEFLFVPPGGGGHIQPNGGPVGIGTFNYQLSAASTRVREQADAAIRSVCERHRVGRFLSVAETEGVYAAHPLGGCRMADEVALGVTDHACEVFGAEGLFCMDSSVFPTSLGVNPSLTIAAVCERAAGRLVGRGADFGLPQAPPGFRHRPPSEHVGPRVVPGRR
jgi:choline dehydrogenase-like flavoprotein